MKSIKLTKVLMVAVALVIAIGASISIGARADQFDEQIAQLQRQNAAKRDSLSQLQEQATSYQDLINKLQAKINSLQAAIDANLAKQAKIKEQIKIAEVELDKQKRVLGESIRAMYVQGQISTLEMLASSQDLSEFVDKKVYQSAVQSQIKETLDKVTALKLKLVDQKTEVEQLLEDQKAQQTEIAGARDKQNELLAYNQNQQTSYNQQIASNQAKIGDLRRQQAILNAQYTIGNMRGDPNNGGYPSAWANAPIDSIIDDWGMYNRECVSFTAWKVHQDYLAGKNNRDMPYWGGFGNANQWDDNARAYGIPVNSTPKVGAIAVSNAGFYGHVMYVEAVGTVNGQQAIYISQYNASFTGQYSEGWRYTTGLVFIHF